MSTAQETYRMLGKSVLWETARQCHRLLNDADVAHAIVGGVAVCLHGYQRNTVDVDLLIRSVDGPAVKHTLMVGGFEWEAVEKRFVSPSGVVVEFLVSDQANETSTLKLPDPADETAVTAIEELPVISLARLIEMKIACGQDHLRRTHKDFADVVELAAKHNLSRSFAKYLHKSVRKTFRELVLRSRGG